MKKTLVFLMVTLPGFIALFLNLSCSTTAPTAATNFQNPVQTVVAANPSLTFTPTFTFTFTQTFTPTGTPTATFTPYAANTPWTGFSAPSGLAVDGGGNVFVADTGNNLVKKFYPTGLLNPTWGLSIKGKVSTTHPVAVAVNSASTTVYVVGNSTNSLTVYSGSGVQLAQVTTANSQAFSGPQGVALDGSGNVYVSDTGNQRIVKLSYQGGYLGSFATGVSVLGIAVNGSNDVFGAAGNNVLEFSNSGTVLTTIPGFANPTGVALDSGNNLYVADTGNRQVEEFAGTGLLQQPLVIFNNGGQLAAPKGVAVDSSGNIYVSDSGANDVLKFVP